MSVATASILHPQLDIEERLEPAHEQIVRETLPLVGEHIEEIAPVFYGRMFAAHPELLNRPIVVTPRGALLCRPPERVLELL